MLLNLALALLPALVSASPVAIKREDVSTSTQAIIYSQKDNLCLSASSRSVASNGSLSAAPLYDGMPVISLPCDQASTWEMTFVSASGSASNSSSGTPVFVSGTSEKWMLGATIDAFPGGTGHLIISKVVDVHNYTTWNFTEDKRIQLDGTNLCVEEYDGDAKDGADLYECTNGETNQAWTIGKKSPYTYVPTPLVSPPAQTWASTATPLSSSSSSEISTPSSSVEAAATTTAEAEASATSAKACRSKRGL
ncbi:hypothetical protein IAR55_000668 [Kwoniella newhampshirensis]|uniref:Ricin B lectin domain-containing protein n=1 Tax=Kwoniella newhampshirensis TaxID=1651941 RepID=A0AAW0Z7D1_9TREE